MQPGVLSVRKFNALISLLGVSTALACGSDETTAHTSSTLAPPDHPSAAATRLRGTVDAVAGTLTFEPLPASSGPALAGGAPNAAIYGNQGVTIRIYNTPVVTSAPVAGKKTYSANVGLRNLLSYRVGDEQGVTAPADTMGIYVFVNSGPTVTGTSSSCPACAVTVANARGILDFNSTNQQYWFWTEILGPAGSASDTTLLRKPWVFQADTAVTRFSFDVLVSAAWVPPNESVWKLTYPGDSLPDTQAEPRWRKLASATATPTIVGGNLTLTTTASSDSLFYYREDSVRTGTDALLEGRFRLDNGGGRGKPQVGLAIDDSVKFIGVFVSDSSQSAGRAQVGFIKTSAGGGFLAGAPMDTVVATNFHTYQLRKYKSDSVTVWIEGVRRLSLPYSSFPASRAPASPAAFIFGARAPASGNTSTWDYVLYQIGRATP